MNEHNNYIKVRVTANAKRDEVIKKRDVYHIAVKEKTQQGRANKQVQTLLSERVGCNPKQLRLVKGHTTPSKIFLLTK